MKLEGYIKVLFMKYVSKCDVSLCGLWNAYMESV